MSSIGATYLTAIATRIVDIEVNQLQRDVRYAFACEGLTRKPFLRNSRDFLIIKPFDSSIDWINNSSVRHILKERTSHWSYYFLSFNVYQ